MYKVRTRQLRNRKTTFRLNVMTLNSPMNMTHMNCAV